MKRIRLILDGSVAAEADLLEDRAPQTCSLLWRQLERPLDVTGAHAMWTGPEVSVQIPPEVAIAGLDQIPPENQTVMPAAGSLLWAYMPAYALGGYPKPVYDIGIFYAPQGRVFLPQGWVPCNHFAQLAGEWEGFRRACAATRTDGKKALRIERVT